MKVGKTDKTPAQDSLCPVQRYNFVAFWKLYDIYVPQFLSGKKIVYYLSN
jgi:hypothetical protein